VDTLEDMEMDSDVLVLSSSVNEADSDIVGLHDDEGVTVMVGLDDADGDPEPLADGDVVLDGEGDVVGVFESDAVGDSDMLNVSDCDVVRDADSEGVGVGGGVKVCVSVDDIVGSVVGDCDCDSVDVAVSELEAEVVPVPLVENDADSVCDCEADSVKLRDSERL
jgi:hypothetical protein